MNAAQLTAALQAALCLFALGQHFAGASDVSTDTIPLGPAQLLQPPPPPPRHPSCEQHIDFASHFHGFAQAHGVHDHEYRNWHLSALRQEGTLVEISPAKPHAYAKFRRPYGPGDAAIIVSPLFKVKPFGAAADLGRCQVEFEFAALSASLRVRISVHAGDVSSTSIDNLFYGPGKMWSTNDTITSGTRWRKGVTALETLSTPLEKPFMVLFEAVCGRSDQDRSCTPFSTVAVSSLQLSPGCGGCLSEHYSPVECSSSVTTFDHGLDGFQQSSDDGRDWTRHYGATMSLHTGPRMDHTTGKGAYMYVESSKVRRNPGGTAVLTSPEWKLNNASPECTLSFWYLMNGVEMGSLTVRLLVVDDTSRDADIFFREGDQGTSWVGVNVSMLPPRGETIRVSFIATLTDSLTSDVAIDDVALSPGCCPTPPPPPPSPRTTVAAGPVSPDTPTQDLLTANDTTPERESVTSPVEKAKRHGTSRRTATIIGIALPIGLILLILIVFIVAKVVMSKRSKHTEPQRYRHRDEESTGEGDVSANTAAEM